MKLLIVSHTEHYINNGVVCGWGATVREIDHLASLFDEVVHVGWKCEGAVPASCMPYTATNINLQLLAASGGSGPGAKLGVAGRIPAYAWAILEGMQGADVVHVRCPASISLVSLLLMTVFRHPKCRWFKYAGNWGAYPGEPWSYRVQKWWLRKRLAGGLVTINGSWPDQPQHIISFLNPCLDEVDLFEGRRAAERKSLTTPVRLACIGRVDSHKGVDRAIEVVSALSDRDLVCRLAVVGDGPGLESCRRQAQFLGVADSVVFHGWVPRSGIPPILSETHFVLLPSRSEGWPKVLSEGMAFGAVPLASKVSSIPQYLGDFQVGRAIDAADVGAYAVAITEYLERPEIWKVESGRCVESASKFSYLKYLSRVGDLLEPPFGLNLEGPGDREGDQVE